MNEFVPAFTHVAGRLTDLGVPYMVVGSVAAASWGVLRTTRDLDVIVYVANATPESIADALSTDRFYLPRAFALDALSTSGSFNVLDPETGATIDIFVSSAVDEFVTMRLSQRVHTEILGVATWIDSAENLILSKLSWRSSSLSEVQWRDCFEIAAINDLDIDHLREWAAKLDIADDVERLLASLPD